MAKVGGGAAYQRLQVPEDGLSQSLQYWGAQEAKRQADKKLADEREGIRKAQGIKDWEDKYGLKEADFLNKYTGFQTFDDMNTDFSMDLTDQYVNLQRQAKDALLAGDLKTKNKLEAELIKMKSMFGEAAKSQEFFAEKFKSYQKAVTEGKVSGASKQFEDIIQKAVVEKNAALRYRDGNLVYTTIVDGKPEIIPYQDLMDGSFSWYEKQQVSGKNGIVDNVLNNLGTITKEGTDGYYKITTQAWDDKIHGAAVDEAVEAITGSNEVMGDLLYQFTNGKEAKMFGFEDKDYNLVKDKLKTLIRAGYSEKFGMDFNTGKYAADTRAAEKDEDSALSQLNYDADQFMAGDYTGLLGTHESELGESINIREVIPAPNADYVVAVTDTGDKLEVPKTKRGFLEFKIRNKPEYKGLTPEKVMAVAPTKYRTGTIGGAEVSAIAKSMFDAEGKPKFKDERFLKKLKESFDITGEDEFTWGGNSLIINNKKVSTKTQADFERDLKEALGSKEKLNW